MNFNVSPYYDDYDEDKKFLRVLFRPGYSVQARELTQAQTILQKQVQRLGDYVFKNKSRVIPGELKLITAYSIKLEPLEIDKSFNLDTFIQALDNITITGETTGVRATLVLGEPSTSAGDPPLFHIKYVSQGFNGEEYFSQNEVLKFDVVASVVTTSTGGTSETDPVVTTTDYVSPTYTNPRTGEVITAASGSYRVRIQNVSDYQNDSYIANITTGIFYVNGAFVKVDSQRICLSKYTNTPTTAVGLDIVDNIITPEQDTTLLDNSTGTPNYTAPGAHRYRVVLVLTKKDVGYASESFIVLSTLRRGILQFEAQGSSLAELEKVLARRTYDTNGDYTVRDFEIEMRQHRNSDQGVWTGTTAYGKGDTVYYVSPSSGKTNFYICLDSGVSGTSAPTHVSGAVSDGGVRWRFTPQATYNYGIYSEDEGGDTEKIAFGLKNGKAYIKGFEFAVNGVRYVEAPKARSYNKIKNTGVPVSVGNLIDVIPFGVPDIDGFQIVDLYSVDTPPNASQSQPYLTASADGSGTVGSWGYMSAKLTYGIVAHQTTSTGVNEYTVAKILANTVTTTVFTNDMNCWTDNSGASAVSAAYFLPTSKIGTARLRYVEGAQPNGGRATAKISLMDIQMDPGKDFRKVRVIGTPLSVGSTSAGGDPQCFRALVIPQTYNSTQVGTATIATSGNNAATMTGFGTKWLSSNQLTAGDMVWFPNVPSQFFFVRDLQGSDRGALVTRFSTYNISGPLYRADCVFQKPEDGDSIFDMPKKDVLTIRGGETLQENNTTYTTLEKAVVTGGSSDGTYVTLNVSSVEPDQIRITDVAAYVVINNTTGELVNPYDITLNTLTTASIRLNATASRTNSLAYLQNDSYSVFIPTLKRLTNAKEKVKSLVSASQDITIQQNIELDTIKINKADVYRILKIEMFPNVIFGNDISGQITGTGVDITTNYEFDNGQRDTHYDLARLIKSKSVAFPSGPIRITYEYFEHSGGDYFSADSYPDLLYEEIPNYFSKVTGRTISLRDVLDYRPRVNDGGTFDGGTASLTALPQQKYGFQCDFAYYLPRKDKIVLNKSGQFVVIQGVSSENPQYPELPDDVMELFDVEYKPYTYKVNSSNVFIKPIDNKRYTMKDIAKLEKRIANLEDATVLNSLERSTATFSIKDQDGLDRFKNGFVVDNFTGHKVGDVSNPDYECSIDILENNLRPAFYTVGVDMVEVAQSVVERNTYNYRIHPGNIATLPYYAGPEYFYKNKNEIQTIIDKGANATSVELFRKETLIRENNDLIIMEQPYATESVQVTALLTGSSSGTVTLFPSGDTWVETDIPQELVINENGTYDSVAAQADALGIDFGTIWNQWQVTGFGRPVTTVSNSSWRSGAGTYYSSTSVTTQQVSESAKGKTTSLNESVGLTQINGRLTARQSQSYIRSRPVTFVANGLKGGSRVYAFCDTTNVTDYCTQASRLYLAARGFDYSEVPFQFGKSATERNVWLTFNTDDVFSGSTSNYERTFIGSLANSDFNYTTTFTSVFNGTVIQPSSIATTGTNTVLGDVGTNLIPKNSEVQAFTKGEVIKGMVSGATAIVILHEQSTSTQNGNADGSIDCLHVLNIRGTFKAGEPISGTIKRDKLNGGVLTLTLRASSHFEAPSPGNLITSGTGRVAGTWLITSGQTINNKSSPKFLTGKRTFSLQDTITNTASSAGIVDRTCYADAVYSAVGIIDAGGGGVVGVRNASVGVGDVTRDRSYTQTLASSTSTSYVPDPPPPQSQDPLAQTFIVSSAASMADASQGSFVTDVELFFANKDPISPIAVEIRTTQNGYPTTTTLPFGQKYLYPSQILTSTTGTVGTRVRFDAPVYVKEGEMYCVVLSTLSPTYSVYTATLEKTDISNNKLGKVLKNPATGSMFRSQNSATWSESSTQDLKMVIYRAIFNTTSSGTTVDALGTSVGESFIYLKPKDIKPLSNSGRQSKFTKLALNPFRCTLGKSEIIVRQPNHGMIAGAYVTYQNVTGSESFGFTNALFNTGTHTETQYDIKTAAYVTTGTIVKHKVYKVYSHDLYSIRLYDTSGSARLATGSGQFGGDQMYASMNALYTVLHPSVAMMNLEATTVTGQIKTTSGRSPTGSETPFTKDNTWNDIILNDNNYFPSQRVILNKQNEIDVLDRANSLELRLQLQTKSKFVSPMVDIDRVVLAATQNRIDDPVTTKSPNSNYYSATGGFDGSQIFFSEYENKQGGAQMGYITRKLQFKNTSKLLKIQFAASVPSNMGIDKSTPSITLPIKIKSGSRTSEHPDVITQRTAITTTYAIGTTTIGFQSVTGIVDGMYVYGPGIQTGTRVNGISGTNVTFDKAIKVIIPSSSSGTVYFFTGFDISGQNKTQQIDVGDYVTYNNTSGSGTPIPSNTYVVKAPKNTYFTKKVGTYSSGTFVEATTAVPVALFNGVRSGIDPTTNTMTFFVDDLTNIKQGMYCYILNYANNDATYVWAPMTVRRVLRVNTDAKSITVEKLSPLDEISTIGYSNFFYFNSNNSVITFFNPTIELNQAVTADVVPTLSSRTATNLLSFTTPPASEVEVYAKITNGGNAVSTSALQFQSNEYNASTNPYGVDSTNDIIYFPIAHNLNTGSAVLYNAQSNVITNLKSGTVYYAIFASTTSIKLATSYTAAVETEKGTSGYAAINISATSVQENHTLTDVNQKNQASIEDKSYFRILPDTSIGGDSSTYGGIYPLAVGKGQLTTTDDPSEYIDHSFTVDNLDPFNTAIIKITMRSRNPAYVPKIKDLRIIATA
jgi:hypothetical protein